MLEFIRENKRVAQIILALLILPFAITGIQGYRNMQHAGDDVAKVAGSSITRQEYESALRDRLERMRQAFGGAVDPATLDSPEARKAVLDQLVTQRALDAEARETHVTVTDDQLRRTIAAIPAFQDNGVFSKTRYDAVLQAQRMTSPEFERRVRSDLALQKLATFPADSAWIPSRVGADVAAAFEQERTVRIATITPASRTTNAEPTAEAIRAYYDANSRSFETPERVDLEYVVLDVASVAKTINVPEDEARRFYEQNRTRYSTPEQRRVRHILVAAGKDASQAQRDAARKKADAIRAEVVQDPTRFESIARKSSDDPGSKDRGGDLDFLGRGATVKPFEDAMFALKAGEISPVIETDFGFHVIQLVSVREPQTKPFDEVRAAIESEVRKQAASKRFAEAAETLTNTVYEQADALKPAADKLGLPIRVAKGFSRETAATIDPQLANAKFVDAVFADDAIRNKHNTQAIEIAPNTLAAGHVLAHEARRTRPLEEVRSAIVTALKTQEATRLAKEAGEAALAGLRAGKDGDLRFGDTVKVSRRKPAPLSPDALRAVMRADASKLPAFVGVDLREQGFQIVRIDAVGSTAATETNDRSALEEQVRRVLAEAETRATVEAVRARSKVQVYGLPTRESGP